MFKLIITVLILLTSLSTMGAEIRGNHNLRRLASGRLTTLIDIEFAPNSELVYFYIVKENGVEKAKVSSQVDPGKNYCFLRLNKAVGVGGGVLRKGKVLLIDGTFPRNGSTEQKLRIKSERVPSLSCVPGYNSSQITIDQFLAVIEGIFEARDLVEAEPVVVEP